MIESAVGGIGGGGIASALSGFSPAYLMKLGLDGVGKLLEALGIGEYSPAELQQWAQQTNYGATTPFTSTQPQGVARPAWAPPTQQPGMTTGYSPNPAGVNAGGVNYPNQWIQLAKEGAGAAMIYNPATGQFQSKDPARLPGPATSNTGTPSQLTQPAATTAPTTTAPNTSTGGKISPQLLGIGGPGGGLKPWLKPAIGAGIGIGGAIASKSGGGGGGGSPNDPGGRTGPGPDYPTNPSPGGTTPPGGGPGGTVPTNPSWLDPSFYTPYNSAPASQIGPNPPGFNFTTAEPPQMAEQDRIRAAIFGNAMDQDLRNQVNLQGRQAGKFQNWLVQGPGGYGDILQGKGGFSAPQQANITQEGLIKGGMATPGQLNEYQLTPNELAAMKGSPLGYIPGVARAYQTAIDPSKLGLSGAFQQGYQFGPGDMQNIVDQAGRTVGVRTQSEQDQLERAAAAQGQTSPLALAAAESRIKYGGDIGAADAMTAARIQAKQLGLQTTLGQEQMRLGSEQDISGRQIGAIGNLASLTQSGEAQAAARAANTAAAQRANLTTRLGTQYGQAYNTGAYLGNQYKDIYGTQLGQEQKARDWLAQQQTQAAQLGQNAESQRIGAFGASSGPITSATGQTMAWKKADPNWYQKMLGGAAAAPGIIQTGADIWNKIGGNSQSNPTGIYGGQW